MANAGGFRELLPEPNFPFGHYPDLCFSDDVTMLDASDPVLDSLMNIQSCLPPDGIAHLLPSFPINVDVDTICTHEMAMLEAPFLQTGFHMNDIARDIDPTLGSTLVTGDHLYQDYSTHHLTISPSDATSNAMYNDGMPVLDAPIVQSTPHVDTTPRPGAGSDDLASGTTYAELDNTHMQEGPVIHAPLGTCARKSSECCITTLAPPMQTRYATAEDWERHRALFTQLYRAENKTLEEVKSIMKERYGFNATDKMYKKRIKDWYLHKNCKASEKEEVLRCVEKNRKLGIDPGVPMINGRTIKMHVIERHRKEKRKTRSPSPSVVDSRSAKCARPRRPTCSTWISFSRIEDPTDYRDFQNLLFHVDQYYNSKLEIDPCGAWEAWIRSGHFRGMKISYTFEGGTYTCALENPWDIFNRYTYAVGFLKANRTREAWRMIQEGAEMVRPVLLQESPNLVRELLLYLSVRSPEAHAGVKMQLLNLISGMANAVYGSRHPISSVCQLLQSLHRKQDVIELTMRKLGDVLKHRLGQNHWASLTFQRRICEMLLEQRRVDEAEQSFCELVGTCECFLGCNAPETRRNLLRLADLYYLTNRSSEAEVVLVDLLQRGKEWGECDECEIINVFAKVLQGYIYWDRGDYGAAEALLWSALSGSLLRRGARDQETIRVWVEYQAAKNLHQKHQDASAPLPPAPEALPEVSEEPVRCLSRNRSSSLPPMDRRERETPF